MQVGGEYTEVAIRQTETEGSGLTRCIPFDFPNANAVAIHGVAYTVTNKIKMNTTEFIEMGFVDSPNWSESMIGWTAYQEKMYFRATWINYDNGTGRAEAQSWTRLARDLPGYGLILPSRIFWIIATDDTAQSYYSCEVFYTPLRMARPLYQQLDVKRRKYR